MSSSIPNTYCEICGAKYYRCMACEKIGSWKLYCDTPEHFQVYLIIKEYKSTNDSFVARKSLEHIGITPSTSHEFLPYIEEILSKIFEEI